MSECWPSLLPDCLFKHAPAASRVVNLKTWYNKGLGGESKVHEQIYRCWTYSTWTAFIHPSETFSARHSALGPFDMIASNHGKVQTTFDRFVQIRRFVSQEKTLQEPVKCRCRLLKLAWKSIHHSQLAASLLLKQRDDTWRALALFSATRCLGNTSDKAFAAANRQSLLGSKGCV